MRVAAALSALALVACGAPARDERGEPGRSPGVATATLRWVAPGTNVDFPGPTNSDGSRRVYPPPPADVPGTFLTLNYDAFGPQAMAFGLLGMEPYRFLDSACCFEPGDRFDVRVVVYRDAGAGDQAAAAARYPTSAATGDYRLVSVATALVYVDDNLPDLRGDPPAERLRSLEADLGRLRATLVDYFGEQ